MGEGIWLGTNSRTQEVFIGTGSGVFKCRTIKRLPEEEKWNAELVNFMKGTTWQPVPGRGGTELRASVKIAERQDVLPGIETGTQRDQQARRMYIVKEDIKNYGYTKGCKGCNAIRCGGIARNHSEECRTRIEARIREEEDEPTNDGGLPAAAQYSRPISKPTNS